MSRSTELAASERRSIKELIRDAATHGEAVVRGEVRLAIAEAKEELQQTARQGFLMLAAAGAAFLAFVLLLGAGLIALTKIMDPALAFLVAAALCIAVAVLLARGAGKDTTPADSPHHD